jgi:hypothetical protein
MLASCFTLVAEAEASEANLDVVNLEYEVLPAAATAEETNLFSRRYSLHVDPQCSPQDNDN